MKPGVSGVFNQMSYCPQEEPLWPLITVEEHLECYAALRGVAAINRKAFVNR
jgi:ATP-binding cassette subfamily A (ABC1) protein 5